MQFQMVSPFVLGLIITNKCNLKCVHCINSAGENDVLELPFETIKNLIDDAVHSKIPVLDINGGEPFVRNDLDNILDYAISKGMKTQVTTNGTLITNQWLQKYKGKVSALRISIDSPFPEVHDKFRGAAGSFEKTLNNVINARKNGFLVQIQTTISRLNQDSIEKMVELMVKCDVTALNVLFLVPAGKGAELSKEVLSPKELKQFILNYHNIKKRLIESKAALKLVEECPQNVTLTKNGGGKQKSKCGAGFTEMVVLNDGYALPCAAFIARREDFRAIDLDARKNSLLTIYKDSVLFKQVRQVQSITGKCKDCDYLIGCGGGCRAAAYLASGDIFHEDVICWHTNEQN